MKKISKGTFDILKQYQLFAKKKYGQNFIHDENTLNNIVVAANVTKNDTVIEIGVGLGALTQLLCERANEVYAFEIDKDLKPFLDKHVNYSNLKIAFNDFLKVDLPEILPNNELKVVANLPYYITTPILFKIANSELNFTEIYVMMQKEVGDRISSKESKKSYNALSVVLQVKYDITEVLSVSKNVFVPKPNVDSVVMCLKKHNKFDVDEAKFSDFVHSAFEHKRKNLRNNFKNYDKQIIETILKKYGLSLTSRAEQITVDQYVDLFIEYTRRT